MKPPEVGAMLERDLLQVSPPRHSDQMPRGSSDLRQLEIASSVRRAWSVIDAELGHRKARISGEGDQR